MVASNRIAQDVLVVLSGLEIKDQAVRITEQLDRKLYTRVNEVLEALGGKWNRKAKAHLFADDPAERLDEAILTGSFTRPQDFGFFPTPSDLADRLVDAAGVTDQDVVLEPSAGQGALVDAILRRAPGAAVIAVELLPANVRVLREKYRGNDRISILEGNLFDHDPELPDFFDSPTCAVMNPPFARHADLDHVHHVWLCWLKRRRTCAIMSAGVSFRQDTRTSNFREFVTRGGGSIEPLPEGSFKTSGTSVNTVLVTMPEAS
jgi:predicted RNA methylase